MKRPFWMHQLVEYIVGVLLVSQGLQASEAAVPVVLGSLVIANAATAKGPVAAFPKVPRPIHRVLDVVAVVLLAAGAAGPSSLVDSTLRVVLGGSAAILAFVAWRTDYTVRPSRSERREARRADETSTPSTDRSEAIGRAAGRGAGALYNAARQRRRP